MVDRFVSYATGPAFAPGAPGAVIRIDRDGEAEMVNLLWGLRPFEPDGRPCTYVRSEGRRFASHRCLIPASEFTVSNGTGRTRRKWRVTLRGADEFFYLAGIWRPQGHDWPASYALVTIAASEDIAPVQDRQVALIRRKDRMVWLDPATPEEEVLKALPGGSFTLEQVEGPRELPLPDSSGSRRPYRPRGSGRVRPHAPAA